MARLCRLRSALNSSVLAASRLAVLGAVWAIAGGGAGAGPFSLCIFAHFSMADRRVSGGRHWRAGLSARRCDHYTGRQSGHLDNQINSQGSMMMKLKIMIAVCGLGLALPVAGGCGALQGSALTAQKPDDFAKQVQRLKSATAAD